MSYIDVGFRWRYVDYLLYVLLVFEPKKCCCFSLFLFLFYFFPSFYRIIKKTLRYCHFGSPTQITWSTVWSSTVERRYAYSSISAYKYSNPFLFITTIKYRFFHLFATGVHETEHSTAEKELLAELWPVGTQADPQRPGHPHLPSLHHSHGENPHAHDRCVPFPTRWRCCIAFWFSLQISLCHKPVEMLDDGSFSTFWTRSPTVCRISYKRPEEMARIPEESRGEIKSVLY